MSLANKKRLHFKIAKYFNIQTYDFKEINMSDGQLLFSAP